MRSYSINIFNASAFIILTGFSISCNKLVSVDEPIDSVTAEKMYKNEPQAEGALVGVYNSMIHGTEADVSAVFKTGFAGGLSTYAGGLSAGELFVRSGTNLSNPDYALATNRLSLTNSIYAENIWKSAYNVIYNANSVIEGIANVKTTSMRDSVKKQFTAEAKFLRAFAYFYLVNYFGDVPLVLTVDFNETAHMSRTPVNAVYTQIQQDLEEAEKNLSADFSAGKGLRVRASKWAAKAMLAKVHLYRGNMLQAATKASEVINQELLFKLVPLNDVFLTQSKEAIFQLRQTDQSSNMRNGTAEAWHLIPASPYEGAAHIWLTPEVMNRFEFGDQRRLEWTDSTLQTIGGFNTKAFYPTKYKTGVSNSQAGMPSNEYYMVLRLAEMYLIRAEARANGEDGGHTKAIEDLNKLRFRASLGDLPQTLDAAAVKAAVEQERAIELFAEWGNRWLDLKRTGKASSVLSSISAKQPWEGDYQLLYPIPNVEILRNNKLIQNTGYVR